MVYILESSKCIRAKVREYYIIFKKNTRNDWICYYDNSCKILMDDEHVQQRLSRRMGSGILGWNALKSVFWGNMEDISYTLYNLVAVKPEDEPQKQAMIRTLHMLYHG